MGIMRPRSRDKSSRQVEMIDRLAKRFGRFALVAAVAKRAGDLKERIDPSLDPSGGGMIDRAISEIARGDVRIRGGKPGEEVSEG